MFSVVAAIILAGNAYAGHVYPQPNLEIEGPKIIPKFQQGIGQRTIQENPAPHTHVVSYSVPFKHYHYLRQHQNDIRATNTHGIGPTVSASNVNTLHAPSIKSVNSVINSATYTPELATIPAPINYQSNIADSPSQNINIPAVNIPAVILAPTINEQNNFPANIDQHINIPAVNLKNGVIPPPINEQTNLLFNVISHNIPNRQTLNLPATINQRSNLQNINIPALNSPSVEYPTSIHQLSNTDLTPEHHSEYNDISSDFRGQVTVQNPVIPKITTDIYFHVPPSEINEPVFTVRPKKKIYKIIFIKVPSQETKNIFQLQRNVYNEVAPIEDKTIIYVLSKKLEPQPVSLPKSIPSEHEVLFVKYQGGPTIPITQKNESLEDLNSDLLLTPRLKPGLLNGK